MLLYFRREDEFQDPCFPSLCSLLMCVIVMFALTGVCWVFLVIFFAFVLVTLHRYGLVPSQIQILERLLCSVFSQDSEERKQKRARVMVWVLYTMPMESHLRCLCHIFF